MIDPRKRHRNEIVTATRDMNDRIARHRERFDRASRAGDSLVEARERFDAAVEAAKSACRIKIAAADHRLRDRLENADD